jgi:hypothetical protein
MRALIFVAIAVVVGIAGYLMYRQSAATGPSPGMFAEAPPPVLPVAEDCTVANAVYEYGEDARLRLRFETINAGDGLDVYDERFRTPGNVNAVIQVTSTQTNYTFAPDNAFMPSGPKYQTLASYFRPAGGGARVRVSLFDSTMHAINEMPRYDSVAPAYIYMPDAFASLYAARIDLPPGAFRFQSCDQPAPAP